MSIIDECASSRKICVLRTKMPICIMHDTIGFISRARVLAQSPDLLPLCRSLRRTVSLPTVYGSCPAAASIRTPTETPALELHPAAAGDMHPEPRLPEPGGLQATAAAACEWRVGLGAVVWASFGPSCHCVLLERVRRMLTCWGGGRRGV